MESEEISQGRVLLRNYSDVLNGIFYLAHSADIYFREPYRKTQKSVLNYLENMKFLREQRQCAKDYFGCEISDEELGRLGRIVSESDFRLENLRDIERIRTLVERALNSSKIVVN